MSKFDTLDDLEWIALPNEPYIMKYAFHNYGYHILITDLVFIYEEKLLESDIQIRFSKQNPYAQMKPQVILENLKKSLQQDLKDKSNLSMKIEPNRLVLTLCFLAVHVQCSYDIDMSILPAEQLMNYVIRPTIFGALLSQQKVRELQKRISCLENKDNPVSSKDILISNWFTTSKNVSFKTVLESFLKIQNHFKELCAENQNAFCSLTEGKPENVTSCTSLKKCKPGENSSSIKFEDDEKSIFIKKEENNDEISTEPLHLPVKKKKTIKF